jgi:hypothetical protein
MCYPEQPEKHVEWMTGSKVYTEALSAHWRCGTCAVAHAWALPKPKTKPSNVSVSEILVGCAWEANLHL